MHARALGRPRLPHGRSLQSGRPVSQSNQALWFDAVPLLVVAAAVPRGGRVAGATPAAVGPSPASWRFSSRSGWWQASTGSFWRSSAKYRSGGIWLTFGLAVLLGLPALLVLRSAARPESSSVEPERESATAPRRRATTSARSEPGGGPRPGTVRCPDLGSRSLGAGHRRVVAGRRGGDRPRARGEPLPDPPRPARRHPDRAVARDRFEAGQGREASRGFEPRGETPPDLGDRECRDGAGARRRFARRAAKRC